LSRRRRRWSPQARRTLRRALLGVVGLALLLGLLAGYRLVRAAQDLRAAQRLVTRAGEAIEAGEVRDGGDLLDRAADRLGSAARSLDGHLEVDALKVVPVLGTNVRAVRRSISAATHLTIGGSAVLDAAAALQRPDGRLDVPLRDGQVPLGAVQEVQQAVADLHRTLEGDRDLLGSDRWLVGPVRDLHRRVADEVRSRRAQVDVLDHALGLLADLAGANGPRSYLIAVANSAEMRGSGGMVLSYGGLGGHDGTFVLSQFDRIDALRLDAPLQPSDVPGVPADYLRRWDGFDPLELWRNANLAADFRIDAPVLEAMTLAASGIRADGVVQIDPIGLAGLLRAVGPVEVPEVGMVDADGLVPLVLHDAYVRYEGIDRRSDVLKDVAQAAFQRLLTGQYDSLRALGTALAEAAQGRHLMLHAVDPAVEAHARALGADGSLPDLDGTPAVHLTVQNVSANKLDWFVDTAVGLSGDVARGTVRAEVLVRNDAPAGVSEPKYIFGPFDGNQQVGLYRGVVSLYLPRGATLVGVSGDQPRSAPIKVSEDRRPVVSWTVDLPAQASSHVVLDLRLPPGRTDGRYQLAVVPSARVRPTALRVDLAAPGGRIRAALDLDRTWRLRPGRDPEAVAGPVDPPLQRIG
jgi:hypothetical protein